MKAKRNLVRAKAAVKRAAAKVEAKVEEALSLSTKKPVNLADAATSHYGHRGQISEAELAEVKANPDPYAPSAEVLDSLAAIARRVDDFLAHGPAVNMENRLRARINTPGLKEWVAARLVS